MKSAASFHGIVCLVVIVTMLCLCTSPSDVPSTGSISGVAVDAQNGAALSGVTIISDPVTETVATNEKGEYCIGNVPVGEYTVTAARDFFTSITKSIAVCGGQTAQADFVLIASCGSIAGLVVDRQSQAGLSGVVIKTQPVTGSVSSINDGSFTVSGVEPGCYTVYAEKCGYINEETIVQVKAGAVTKAVLNLEKVGPLLSVSPQELDFSTAQSTLQLTIMNQTQVDAISFSITKPVDAAWLSLSHTGGTLTTSALPVICTVARENCTPGNYSTTLTITSNGGTKNVPVLMSVLNPDNPQLTVSKKEIDFGSTAVTAKFTITNTGTGSLSFSVTDDMEWCSCAPAQGSINSGSAVVTATANRTMLSAGKIYTGVISVQSSASAAAITVYLKANHALLPPVTMRAETISENGCILRWSRCTGQENFTGYALFVSGDSTVDEITGALVSNILSINDTSAAVKGVAGSTQFYRVYVYNKDSVGSPGNIVGVSYPVEMKSWTKVSDSWNIKRCYMYKIQSLNDSCAIACGSNDDGGVVLHWDNSKKEWVAPLLPPDIASIRGLHLISETCAYAAACGNSSQKCYILFFNGAGWKALYEAQFGITSKTPGDVYACSESDIWVVIGGLLYHIKDGVWQAAGISVESLCFVSAENGYATCGNKLYAYNGFGWSKLLETATAYRYPCLTRDGLLAFIENNNNAGHYVVLVKGNAVVKRFLTPSGNVNSLFACSATAVWTGGGAYDFSAGELWFYDGAGWKRSDMINNPRPVRLMFHSPASGWAFCDGSKGGIFMYR